MLRVCSEGCIQTHTLLAPACSSILQVLSPNPSYSHELRVGLLHGLLLPLLNQAPTK